MPASPSKNKKNKRCGPRRARTRTPPGRLQRVADLAWAGQHAPPSNWPRHRSPSPAWTISERLDLLDLRAECFIAQGNLDAADADAAAMLDLARRARKTALLAQALNRRAIVEMRPGNCAPRGHRRRRGEGGAQARNPRTGGDGLYRLAEAQFRLRLNETAAKSAAQAAKLFKSQGDLAGQGRALWAMAAARSGQGRAGGRCGGRSGGAGAAMRRPLRAGQRAATCRRSTNPTWPSRCACCQQSRPFATAGYAERQGVCTHNLGLAYSSSDSIGAPAACCSRSTPCAPDGTTRAPATPSSCSRWSSMDRERRRGAHVHGGVDRPA